MEDIENLKIFNGTPTDLNIYADTRLNPVIRKYVGGRVIFSLPSTKALHAIIDMASTTTVGAIPLFEKKIVACDALPEGYDMYILSPVYAQAYKMMNPDDDRIYTIVEPSVVSTDGKTLLGYRGIMKV